MKISTRSLGHLLCMSVWCKNHSSKLNIERVEGRILHAISFARNDFLSSIQGEQAVRALLKTENILKRLLKSKPESSSRIFF